MLVEHVADGAAGDAQKGAAEEAVEEAGDEQRLCILGHGAGDNEDEDKGVCCDVYRSTSVELRDSQISGLAGDPGITSVTEIGRLTSDSGASSMGPNARPTTKVVRPRVATSREMWNCGSSWT